MQGKLIVLEGIDGSGKSTQFKLLCDRLNCEKIEYKRITFPRYDNESSALIRMYLGGQFGTQPGDVNAYAASSFFAVDRYASFIQDWREYYDNGGLILTDRYTTSNAIHQGAKMKETARKVFFEWLYEYEFKLIGLPRPDLTFYMNLSAEIATKRLGLRQKQTDTNADIHECDIEYLQQCAECGMQAATHFGWKIIDCVPDGVSRSEKDIHAEIFSILRGCL